MAIDQISQVSDEEGVAAHGTLNVRERSELLGNLIYRQIFEGIKRGDYAARDRLPTERRLMEQFGAARNTVRKALARLAEDGLIQRQMGSGTYVAVVEETTASPESFPVSPLDVLEARMAIEPGFADLLVARATEADFVRMEEHLDELERATDQQSFRMAGYAFHLEIARATRNPLLIRIFEMIIEARARAGWDKLRYLNDHREAQLQQIESNRRVLQALRDRDKARARQLMRAHLWSMIADVAGQVQRD